MPSLFIIASIHWVPIQNGHLSYFLVKISKILYGIRTVPDIDNDDIIPEINNGYWIFKDRTSKEKKERFPDVRSGNYSVGVIDLDTNTLHYIKFDS